MKYFDLAGRHYDNLVHEMRAWNEDRSTGEETCLRRMIRETAMNPSKQWFWAREFIGGTKYGDPYNDSLFGSYKAPARISDLAVAYPFLIERTGISRFTLYRIRYELLWEVIPSLPENIRKLLFAELKIAYGDPKAFVNEQNGGRIKDFV